MSPRPQNLSLTPPLADRRLVRTVLHGTERIDPYGWITDPEIPEVADYLAAERAYYDGRAAALSGVRSQLAAEMIARVPALEQSSPWDNAGWRYERINVAGSDHPQLCRTPIAGGERDLLLDLQEIHDLAGTGYLDDGELAVSPDGRWLAWSVDTAGDEIFVLRFRDLLSGLDLGDVVERTYAGGAWAADSQHFLYTVPDETYRPYQVWCHRLGTGSQLDILVFQEDDDRFEIEVSASRTGTWLVIDAVGRDTREVLLLPADDVTAQPVVVRPRQDGIEYEVEHAPGHGRGGADGFLIVTNLYEVEFEICWAPVERPGEWQKIGIGHPGMRVRSVDAFRAAYVVSVRAEGHAGVVVVSHQDNQFAVMPQVQGGGVWVGRNEDYDVGAVTLWEASFVRSPVWWNVDLADGSRTVQHERLAEGVDIDSYIEQRILVPGSDGAQLPVVLVRHVDTPLDGTAPCLLYGYGAYEVSCDSDFGFDFWRTLPSLLDRGVVFAVGHPRGGGEQGRAWWLAGHGSTKATTFSDQIAIADALADSVVDGSRIVSRGLSAGGLLQGAVYFMRPDRWAGVVAEVPFVDVITSMLDPSLPLTTQEWPEWGNPTRADDYEWMSQWSPYDNRPPIEGRPPLLVTGAVHDPRVLVREPAKWVAALRHDDPNSGAGVDVSSPVSEQTVLFRCQTGAGAHTGPAGRFGELQAEAEIYAWVLAALRV